MKSSCVGTEDPACYLKRAVREYREELLSKGLSEEKFISSLTRSVGHSEWTYSAPRQKTKCSCTCFLKCMWLLLLGFLTFALLVAGYRPLSFWVHKVSFSRLSLFQCHVNTRAIDTCNFICKVSIIETG